MVNPVFETEASPQVKQCYDSITQALEVRSLPLFFAYIGAYPEYLQYITEQLVHNLKDPRFTHMITEIGAEMVSLAREELPKSQEMKDWFARYSTSPQFYYFQQDIEKIIHTNITLAFVFVALREAVKGWAVAAKKLPPSAASTNAGPAASVDNKAFIFEDTEIKVHATQPVQSSPIRSAHTNSYELTVRGNFAIEKDLLPEYLDLCKKDFYAHMQRTDFWKMRVGLEKVILNTLPLLPHLIFSPINVVLELTQKYQNFPDLLYLLSEHFPTYAVQRMMFSISMQHS